MRNQEAIKNLAASIVNDTRYEGLKLSILEQVRSWESKDNSEAYGAFKGVFRAFEYIEEQASEVKEPEKLKKHKPKDIPFNKTNDPDLDDSPL